jgi:hypothetical protein
MSFAFQERERHTPKTATMFSILPHDPLMTLYPLTTSTPVVVRLLRKELIANAKAVPTTPNSQMITPQSGAPQPGNPPAARNVYVSPDLTISLVGVEPLVYSRCTVRLYPQKCIIKCPNRSTTNSLWQLPLPLLD